MQVDLIDWCHWI